MRPKVWLIGGTLLYFASEGAEYLHTILATAYPFLDTLVFTGYLACVIQIFMYVYKTGIIRKEKNNR